MLLPGLAGAITGLVGMIIGATSLFAVRRHRIQADQTREEIHIMLRQHQTEYQDGIGQVARAVEFLEKSGQSSEAVLRGKLTHSVRSQAIQLLRSGMSPDSAAAAAGIARREMHLISRVSQILSSHL
jgi:hypothetical protein